MESAQELPCDQIDTSVSQTQPKISPARKPYGNLIILFKVGAYPISIGPDYLMFIAALLGFSLSGMYIISLVNSSFDSLLFKVINVLMVCAQVGGYLTVALSEPGVIIRDDSAQIPLQLKSDRFRYCEICQVVKERRAMHCSRCGVCVRGYDHHCPWVSKCIGKNNISSFNFFVGFTPLYIMYLIILVIIVSIMKEASKPHRH